jgi:hypothetical protein
MEVLPPAGLLPPAELPEDHCLLLAIAIPPATVAPAAAAAATLVLPMAAATVATALSDVATVIAAGGGQMPPPLFGVPLLMVLPSLIERTTVGPAHLLMKR